MKMHARAVRGAFLGLSGMMLLAACGGGNSSTSAPSSPPPSPPPPTESAGPSFTAGVFEPSSNFEDRCEVVRAGVDIQGDPFPDRPGSTLEENFFLRSWTNETYLFNTDVVDRDPADFDDPVDYFAVLRTTAQTPSGRDVDEFHFSQPTEDFLAARNSAPRAGYGARFVAFSTVPPRDFRVLFTEPGSPASEEIVGQPNLVRGSRILEIDGLDFVNDNRQASVDLLNEALFPPSPNVQHTFLVEDPDGARRAIMMTSANVTFGAINRTRIIATPGGPVGYLLVTTFSPFAAEADIADAVADMRAAGVTDLVLDLRYNGGGLLAIASQLAYAVAGDAATAGRVFEGLQFNAAAGDRNPVDGSPNNPLPFFSTGLGFSLPSGAPLQSLDLPRVFILSTGATCSASESIINGLRGVGVEVVLIGGTTCGKPFGFFPESNCGETYFTIQFRGVNDAGFGDYADGFVPNDSPAAFGVRTPGCVVADDLDSALGDETERLLATALSYRENGVCPSPPIAAAPPGVTTSSVDAALPRGRAVPVGGVMETNRDMRMPNR